MEPAHSPTQQTLLSQSIAGTRYHALDSQPPHPMSDNTWMEAVSPPSLKSISWIIRAHRIGLLNPRGTRSDHGGGGSLWRSWNDHCTGVSQLHGVRFARNKGTVHTPDEERKGWHEASHQQDPVELESVDESDVDSPRFTQAW